MAIHFLNTLGACRVVPTHIEIPYGQCSLSSTVVQRGLETFEPP